MDGTQPNSLPCLSEWDICSLRMCVLMVMEQFRPNQLRFVCNHFCIYYYYVGLYCIGPCKLTGLFCRLMDSKQKQGWVCLENTEEYCATIMYSGSWSTGWMQMQTHTTILSMIMLSSPQHLRWRATRRKVSKSHHSKRNGRSSPPLTTIQSNVLSAPCPSLATPTHEKRLGPQSRCFQGMNKENSRFNWMQSVFLLIPPSLNW